MYLSIFINYFTKVTAPAVPTPVSVGSVGWTVVDEDCVTCSEEHHQCITMLAEKKKEKKKKKTVKIGDVYDYGGSTKAIKAVKAVKKQKKRKNNPKMLRKPIRHYQ